MARLAPATALAFALRRLRDEPVRFLLTRRVPSPPPLGLDRAPPWLPVQRVDVGPLSLAALQRLLRVRRGDALTRPALRRVHDVSGGNPLFALELAGALEGHWSELAPGRPLPVPDELGELLRGRLAGLPAGTRDALLAAALLAEPTASDALAPAVEAGVVTLAGRRVRFTPPLFAATIVESAGPEAVRAMHRRLAGAPHPEQRARHLALAAEGPDEVVATEPEAATAVAARGAPEAAAELAEHAHGLTPEPAARDRRALLCARYAWAAGDAARARQHLQAAAEGPLRAQALVDLARLDIHAGDRRAAAALYREAEAAVEEDRELLAQIHEGLAWCLFLTREDVPAAARHACEAVALADDPVVLGDALSVQAQTEFFLGAGLPSPAMERALAIHPADTADVRVLRQPRMHWAVILQNAGRLDEARELLEDVRASAAEHGDDSAGPWVLMRLGQVELLAGRWDVAEELLEAAHELARETGQQPLETTDAVRPRAALRAAGARRGGADGRRRGPRRGGSARRRHRHELRPVGARVARALARERQGRRAPARRASPPDRRVGHRRPGRAALARRPDRGARRAGSQRRGREAHPGDRGARRRARARLGIGDRRARARAAGRRSRERRACRRAVRGPPVRPCAGAAAARLAASPGPAAPGGARRAGGGGGGVRPAVARARGGRGGAHRWARAGPGRAHAERAQGGRAGRAGGPTARSPPRCSCPSARSSRTCPTPIASWACARGPSSRAKFSDFHVSGGAPFPGDFGEIDRRVRAAAEALASEGVPLRHERSILVPEDEMCLLIYDAPSAQLALEASRRAGLVSERVVEAIELRR